jgi:hypothetical protein
MPEQVGWEDDMLRKLLDQDKKKIQNMIPNWKSRLWMYIRIIDKRVDKWVLEQKLVLFRWLSVVCSLIAILIWKRIVVLIISLVLWLCLLIGIVFLIAIFYSMMCGEKYAIWIYGHQELWLRDMLLSKKIARLFNYITLFQKGEIEVTWYQKSVLNLPLKKLQMVIQTILDLSRRDFIESWYYETLTQRENKSSFPLKCQRLAEKGLNQLVGRSIQNFDAKSIIQDIGLPLLIAHIDVIRIAEKRLRAQLPTHHINLTPSDALHRTIVEYYQQATQESLRQSNMGVHSLISMSTTKSVQRMIGARHRLPTSKSVELKFLRSRIDSIMMNLFPKEEMKSPTVRHLLREILVCKVLLPAFDFLAEPDTINQLLLSIVTRQLQNKNLLQKLREQLKEIFEISDEKEESFFPTLATPKMQTFEEFLDCIKKCDDLIEARGLYQQIIVEVKRKNAQLNDTRSLDILSSKQADEIRRYVNQLLVAKKKIEKTIVKF